MARNRCGGANCNSVVLGYTLSVVISYLSATIVLGIPFLNAANAELANPADIGGLNISWLAVILLLAWFLSGLIGSLERHENALICVLNSAGLPGLILAVLTGAKLLR